MIDLTQTVQTAAAALDRAYPGWPDDVSLGELDMGNASYQPGVICGCIAAQVGYHRHQQTGYFEAEGYDMVIQTLADMGGVTMAELSIAFGSGDDLEEAWRDYLALEKARRAYFAPAETRPRVAV